MALAVESTTLHKLTTRLGYFLGLIYFFSFMDRANVGIAALRMNQDLKLSATMYGLGAGLFFASYAIFEIPSNLLLHRVGARWWIARIMISWGVISALLGFAQGPRSFYLLRFLLGVAEAGLVPGVVYYLTLWYPSRHRAKAYALFFSFAMIAVIFMGPLSTWLMSSTHGIAGFAGWRWMFIVEGVPSIILGFVTIFYLKDAPEEASWLTREEKTWLRTSLEEERQAAPLVEHHSVTAFIADKRLWALTGVYFCWNVGNLGIMFWLPSILKSVGHLSNQQIGFLFSIPFIFAFAGMYVVGAYSDRTGERKRILVVCCFISFVTLAASAFVASPVVAFILICIACFNIWGLQPIFWTLPTAYLGGKSAAAGVALVNCMAGVGGFVGPFVVGWIKDSTGKFAPAVFAIAVAFLVQGFILIAMKISKTAIVHSKVKAREEELVDSR